MWERTLGRESRRRVNGVTGSMGSDSIDIIDKDTAMRQEYDFSNAKKNPYASHLKKQPA